MEKTKTQKFIAKIEALYKEKGLQVLKLQLDFIIANPDAKLELDREIVLLSFKKVIESHTKKLQKKSIITSSLYD